MQSMISDHQPGEVASPRVLSKMLSKVANSNSDWLSFIQRQEAATLFHHPIWEEIIATCYGYRSFVIVKEDGSRITAGMPMIEVARSLAAPRWISLPFTDYCPPLTENHETLAALTDALFQQRRADGIETIEVRAQLPEHSGVYAYSNAVIHTLGLSTDPQAILHSFKKTQVQQCIIKAVRDGVVVRKGESAVDLNTFYRLHLQTRRRIGSPVQPRRFFNLLWKRLIEPGLGLLLLAYKDEIPLAAAIFLSWNGTLIYKYSASDSAYWRLHPNNLLLWNAIEWGCTHDYHTFDFGRTNAADEGLRTFKNGWGTKEELLFYSVIADRPPKPSFTRLKKAMTSVIRNSPVWVCRILGELFYKYAA